MSACAEIAYGGAVLKIPHETILRNFLETVKSPKHQYVAGSVPAIGQLWPGQGGFYAGVIRGETGAPDRHVIVPPTDGALDLGSTNYGCYGVDLKDARSDVYGLPNTIAMAKAGSAIAERILALKANGHDDFYLLSRHEARLCHVNVPELFEKGWHLTSTQSSATSAFLQAFSDGDQNDAIKNTEARVRVVRSFPVSHSII